MEETDEPRPLTETPVRAKDKREAELVELRQKQLAKVGHGQLDAIDDGLGQQPITAEAWENLQKQNSNYTKTQQQYVAALNLQSHNYHAVGVGDDSQTNENKAKLKLKQQELKLEAAQMLHSYRGKPEAILSHQVKRIPTTPAPGSANKRSSGDIASSGTNKDGSASGSGVPKLDMNALTSRFGGGEGEGSISHKEASVAEKSVSVPAATADVDDFLQSLDDFISTPDVDEDEPSSRDNMDDNKDQQFISPQQSNSSGGSTEWVVLAEDEEEKNNKKNDDDDDDDDENWMDMNSEPVISQVLQVQKSEVEMVSPVLTQEAPFVEVTKVADIPQCNEINNNTSPNHDDVEVSHLKEKEDQAVLSAKEEKDNIDEMSMWTNLDNNEEVYTETKAVPVKKVSPPVIPQGNPFIEVQEVTDVSQFRESSESLSLKRDVGSPGPDIQVNTIIQGSVVTPPEWEEKNVSFSFGLLTDGNSSPSHGTYSALTGTGMPLLDNIVSKLQSSALNAIQNEIYSGDLLGGERPLLISVTEDVSFVAPFDRLFMVRCIVKINLPLSLRINGSCDLWRIEAAILNTLRGNLPDMSGM